MRTTAEQDAAIAAARAQRFQTRRPTVPALDEMLFEVLPVLDHGFVRVIDYMGDDAAIVQAARVSYGRGTKRVNEDRGLIRYLMRHHHTTPFEMCELKLHCKLPIFVARQMIRHRTANVNEYSGRYSVLDREFYVPPLDALGVQSTGNRQGRAETLAAAHAERVLALLKDDAARCYDHYQELLNEDDAGRPLRADEPGLARELARINLTLGFYTQWYWKIDLHNLFHFVQLRADPHAQEEIRAYARVIGDAVRRWVPIAWEAFVDFRLEAMTLSRGEREAVRGMLAGEAVDLADPRAVEARAGRAAREARRGQGLAVSPVDVPAVLRQGVRLFNRGRYLDAQVVWEDAWREAPVDDRALLEALVQLAGGLQLRTRRGGMRGAEHLLAQALITLEDYRPAAHGLDVETLVSEFGAYVDWLRSVARPHRFTDELRIPRLKAA